MAVTQTSSSPFPFFEDNDNNKKLSADSKLTFIHFEPFMEPPGPDEFFSFSTSYKYGIYEFYVGFPERECFFNMFGISRSNWIAVKGVVRVSYQIFEDAQMSKVIYSSPKLTGVLRDGRDGFYIGTEEFMTMFFDAMRNSAKAMFCVEVILPAKIFLSPTSIRPFYYKLKPMPLPKTKEEEDFFFDFKKKGCYAIKCSDVTLFGSKKQLYLSSLAIRKQIRSPFDEDLFEINYSADVVDPVLIYLQSHCFEMPKSYDLGYSRRLLEVVKILEPTRKDDLITAIRESLCKKLSNETPDFDSFLQWLSIAYTYDLNILKVMAATMGVCEFYLQFHQKFPEDTRNENNPEFIKLFGIKQDDDVDLFAFIEHIHKCNFNTKVIL